MPQAKALKRLRVRKETTGRVEATELSKPAATS
jgi:hypothetical protein